MLVRVFSPESSKYGDEKSKVCIFKRYGGREREKNHPRYSVYSFQRCAGLCTYSVKEKRFERNMRTSPAKWRHKNALKWEKAYVTK